MKKNKVLFLLFVAVFAMMSFMPVKETKSENKESNSSVTNRDQALNFFVISDWGWSGEKDQLVVADGMAKQAEQLNPQFIVSCGDNFQIAGVTSTTDPLWKSNFENVYTQKSVQVDWFPVLGNHDYKGSTQAQIDYSKISPRWKLEAHYYTFVRKINDSISARFIFLDPPPLVKQYYTKEIG